ncbi:hypothetical protein LINPERHAP1_LOCUS34764 [Linum perenne]
MQDDTISNPRCPKISFSEDEVRSFYKPWSKALVVKILERNFSYQTVKRRLETLWARSGSIQVSDAANSFFLVRFSDQDDYQRAAFRGPWKIYVTRIGNHIGRTVRLDLATSEGARGRYARVCVEVDISKPLLGKYMIEDRTFLVEYESLENICHHCGIYGHKIDSCPQKVVPQSDLEIEVVPEETLPVTPEGDAGSWMMVSRRNKVKVREEKSAVNSTKASGSRFTILQQEEAIPAPQMKGTEVPGTDKPADPIAVKLAADLVEVLQAANAELRTDKTIAKPTVTAQVVRDPLSDISNVTKIKKQGKGLVMLRLLQRMLRT